MNEENSIQEVDEAGGFSDYNNYYTFLSPISQSEKDPINYSEIYKDKHYICKNCSSFPLIKIMNN